MLVTSVLKPFLRGKDIKRWNISFAEQYLLYIPWHFPLLEDSSISGVSKKAEQQFQEKYPAVWRHISKYKTQLSERNKDETGIRYEWYALQRCAATYRKEFEQIKIVYPDIAIRNNFAFDKSGYYVDCTMFMIPKDSLYLLGILNSAVIKFFFPQICPKIRGGFMRFKSIYVEQIPIPTCDNPQPIENLVKKILSAKDIDPKADISHLEHQIDQIVYQLYGLTEEEIAIVQGNAQ